MSTPLSHTILGSQLWINEWMTDEEAESLVRGMVDAGLRVARIFVHWAGAEPADKLWRFENYDRLFRLAEKYGLQITATLCALQPPEWLIEYIEKTDVFDPENPVLVTRTADYTRRVVERYKDSPALHSWILQNEPGHDNHTLPNKYSLKSFRSYLKAVYQGDLEKVCRYYNFAYSGFDDIGIIREDGSGKLITGKRTYACKMDWYRFCCMRLDNSLKAIQDIVKSLDGIHPTTVNPNHILWQTGGCGQDVFSEGGLVDFMGCSAHIAWNHRQLRERNNQFLALINEITKAASSHPKGCYWVTELQAGATIFSGRRPFTPTGAEFTHWLWESIGAGAKGIVYWLYNATDSGFEGLEWGLTNQLGGPSERLDASKAVSDLLNREEAFFSSLQAAAPDAFVLFSHNTQFLGGLEAAQVDMADSDSPMNPRNGCLGGDAMAGAFNMLNDLGLSAGIVYEKKLDALPNGGLLVAPSAYALDAETVAEIEAFVKAGGTLICDSFFACKNGWGRLEPANYEAQRRLFGGCLLDIRSRFFDEPMPVTMEQGAFEGWFLNIQLEEGAYKGRILARFAGGQPAVIERTHGAGRVVYIATIFFQRYFNDPLQGHLDFLSSILPSRYDGTVRLMNPGTRLRAKRLIGDGGDGLLILLNHKEHDTAQLRFDADMVLTDMYNGEVFEGHSGGTLPVSLGGMQVRVFKTRLI